ncbi:MAG: sigma-70 family RNA polymerase sigma factor [Spirochaetales bacterium]|nr:sigma-70 family RNA polymerase sigma factor [Spirochaetales bacterium]
MKNISQLIEQAMTHKHNHNPDNKAFTEIVKHFQDMIFGYSFALIKDSFLARDITQEVFIIAYTHLEQLKNHQAFPGWIKQIAKRECIKMFKQQQNSSLPLSFIDNQREGLMTPQESYEKKESKNEIMEAVKKLPESMRVPVILYYIDGYSQHDVADFLNIKLNAVKKRLQRAREGLKKEMIHMVKDNLKDLRPSNDDTLLNKINLSTTFDTAAKSGQINILEQMIIDGIDVNERDATGRTLLHWAVENNHTDAVTLILQNGGDSSIKDKSGETPLGAAQKMNNREIITLLSAPNKERK